MSRVANVGCFFGCSATFRFAVLAVEQAQTFWNLLEKFPPRTLKLTSLDDEIFEHTLKAFPELAEDDYSKLTKIDEDWMKSEDGKKRWRDFCESLVIFRCLPSGGADCFVQATMAKSPTSILVP